MSLLLRGKARQCLRIPSRSFRFNSTVAPKPKKSVTFLRILGGATLAATVLATGSFLWIRHQDLNPPVQLPPDPEKKTLVVLGSGWGASSLLKNIDNTEWNVIVVSPKNYFLFTPLLPSVAVGTLGRNSIMQSTRYITRLKKRYVGVYEAQAESIDPANKTVTFVDTSPIQGETSKTTIKYDYLVVGVGAEVQTFGIPGVQDLACFMKELKDAEKAQRVLMDCLESAAFPGQSLDEIKRLLHFVVVGGGPTGIEFAGEMHDFVVDDLKKWYPELAPYVRITLVEALSSVLPSFSKQLIDYTLKTFKDSNIDVHTQTMVKEVKPKSVILQMPDKTIKEVPVGMVFWAGGNKQRKVTADLMKTLGDAQPNRRGLTVNDHLQVAGTDGSVYAIGDCTSTSYAPTAQVASQEGRYLAAIFNKMGKRHALERELKELETQGSGSEEQKQKKQSLLKQLEKVQKLRPFQYSHQGSLAYIGSEKAIADLPFLNGSVAIGGVTTYLFWRSAYISTLFSLRNRALVASDWLKTKIWGRDVSRDE